jgi:hypothetical protein
MYYIFYVMSFYMLRNQIILCSKKDNKPVGKELILLLVGKGA